MKVLAFARIRVNDYSITTIQKHITVPMTVQDFHDKVDRDGYTYILYDGNNRTISKLRPISNPKQEIVEGNANGFGLEWFLKNQLWSIWSTKNEEVQKELEEKKKYEKIYNFNAVYGSTNLKLLVNLRDKVVYDKGQDGIINRQHLYHMYAFEATKPYLDGFVARNKSNRTQYNGINGDCIRFGDSLYARNDFYNFLIHLDNNGFFTEFKQQYRSIPDSTNDCNHQLDI